MADLARVFGYLTGRGFSLTQFRTHGSYNTVSVRQRDVWSPWMGSSHTATLLTLYEIGHVITYADPICEHLRRTVERFTEGTELMGAAEVQLQSDLIR